MLSQLKQAASVFEKQSEAKVAGKVHAISGLMIEATLAQSTLGERVTIESVDGSRAMAEVIAYKNGIAQLMLYDWSTGIGSECSVYATGEPSACVVGDCLLGRVLDGIGRPIDGLSDLPEGAAQRPLVSPPPDPLTRLAIKSPLPVGIRAIDGFLTLGKGQRLGLFAGSGVGKSTLLGQITRQTAADVVVVCLVGERGRELRAFIDDNLGSAGMAKSVVVCATSDSTPLMRLKSAQTATTVAEHFRNEGKSVMLIVDSVTRYARALREIGLARGELPARRGFPASVFAELPRLLERSGNNETGSITAIYSVLVEGDDLQEPIADEVRGIVDGHIVLSRALAESGHWPAIDILGSLSRLMTEIVDDRHKGSAAHIRKLLAHYEANKDSISFGTYADGRDPLLDEAIEKRNAILRILHQRSDEHTDHATTLEQLQSVNQTRLGTHMT